MNEIMSQLKQPSTWRGIAILAGVAGFAIAPAQVDAIGALMAAFIGLIEVFRNEK